MDIKSLLGKRIDVLDDGFSDPDVDASAMDNFFPLLCPKVVGRKSGVEGEDCKWFWDSGDGPQTIESLFQTVPKL